MDARSEKLRAALDHFRAQVDAFRDGEQYRRFLDAVATFHAYSPRNACLIVSQCPHATFVRGFKSWLDLGRAVQKGEKGLTILAPRPYAKTVTTDAGEEEHTGISFAAVAVFDVSQTAPIPGHPNPFEPQIARLLDEEAGGNLLAALVAHLESAGMRFVTADPMLRDGANGFYRHADRTICVRPASTLQMLKTAVHETAHAYAHDLPELAKADAEVVAESVAYVVLRHFGLASDGYSVPYVADWMAADRKSFERGLGHIQALAARIIGTLDAHSISA